MSLTMAHFLNSNPPAMVHPVSPADSHIQPKYLSQQTLLTIQGYANIHTFMISNRLKFSNYQHYHHAQVMIEQFRGKMQRQWELERERLMNEAEDYETQKFETSDIAGLGLGIKIETGKDIEKGKMTASESELLNLGQTWPAERQVAEEAKKAKKKEDKQIMKAVEEAMNDRLRSAGVREPGKNPLEDLAALKRKNKELQRKNDENEIIWKDNMRKLAAEPKKTMFRDLSELKRANVGDKTRVRLQDNGALGMAIFKEEEEYIVQQTTDA